MSTEHTPTPWYRVGHDLRGRQGPIEVCPATAHGLTDAEFILRAVNAYGPMLAALKWAATVIRPGSDLHNDMTAAISLAEKEHQS